MRSKFLPAPTSGWLPILLCFLLLFSGGPAQAGGLMPAPKVGGRAPDFELSATNNTAIRLSRLSGRPVLLAFWSPFCSHCSQSLPQLSSFYLQWSKDYNLELLAVAVTGSDSEVRTFASQAKLAFPVLIGNSAIANRYAITGVPTFYLVDAGGFIDFIQVGALSPPELEQKIAAAIKSVGKK